MDRMLRLLQKLGNPQRSLSCLHIAGTKGKGSSCAYVASILREAGFKVGLYTSPHLQDYKERIRLLNKENRFSQGQDVLFADQITETEVQNLLKQMQPVLEALRHDPLLGSPSYFEVLTALAFRYFKKERVDWAVLETGLGGRLDATNVVAGLICGITPISLEHTALLGDSLETIAAEKAAIIKEPTQWVVMAPQEPKVEGVIVKRCQDRGIKCLSVKRDYMYQRMTQIGEETVFRLEGPFGIYPQLKIRLRGRHQIENAVLAVAMTETLRELGFRIPPEAIELGLASTDWPGRLEMIRKAPTIILDCAHNPASCQMLTEAIREFFPGKRILLILGLSVDKDRLGMCTELSKISQEIILTLADHPRAYGFNDATERKVLFGDRFIIKTNHSRQALERALSLADPDDVILVTGSIFLVGELRKEIISEKFLQAPAVPSGSAVRQGRQ